MPRLLLWVASPWCRLLSFSCYSSPAILLLLSLVALSTPPQLQVSHQPNHFLRSADASLPNAWITLVKSLSALTKSLLTNSSNKLACLSRCFSCLLTMLALLSILRCSKRELQIFFSLRILILRHSVQCTQCWLKCVQILGFPFQRSFMNF